MKSTKRPVHTAFKEFKQLETAKALLPIANGAGGFLGETIDVSMLPAYKAVNEPHESIFNIPAMMLDRETAKTVVAMLQRQFDLIDRETQLGQIIEAMEERHESMLDSFLMMVMRKVMQNNGLTEISLDTSSIFSPGENQGVLLDANTPGKLIYRLKD